jgi:HlyD family secretion protein/macrolide-specific efflux system membrane fusion protein
MDSLPDTILTGKVTLIDPIGKTVSGLVKYTVTISLDPTDAPVLFGATATVTIVTSEPRTSLAVPISAVQTDTRGEYVIRIKNDSSTERIDIQSGDLAGKLVTIATTSDLKEGDRVRLGNVSTNGSSGNNDRQQQGPDVIPGGPGGGGAPFGGGG